MTQPTTFDGNIHKVELFTNKIQGNSDDILMSDYDEDIGSLGCNMEDNYYIPFNVDYTPKIERKLIVSINFKSGLRTLFDNDKKLVEETVITAEIISETAIDAIVVNHDKGVKCCYYNCGEVFSNLPSMRKHIKSHSKSQSYRCPEERCNKLCQTYSNLVYHITKHDGKYASYSCNVCDKDIVGSLNYVKHIKNHVQTIYKCTVTGCNENFVTVSSWIYHIKNHGLPEHDADNNIYDRSLLYTCPHDCGKTFRSNHGLRIHLGAHKKDQLLKCPVEGCQKEFKFLHQFNDHRKTHIRAFAASLLNK